MKLVSNQMALAILTLPLAASAEGTLLFTCTDAADEMVFKTFQKQPGTSFATVVIEATGPRDESRIIGLDRSASVFANDHDALSYTVEFEFDGAPATLSFDSTSGRQGSLKSGDSARKKRVTCELAER